MEKGKKNWVFCDGYLPPQGDNPEFEGHEALMLTNLNDENSILVTTMRLLPDSVTKTFEIKYSLVDEDGNLIYFDSSGNVVSEDTPGATQYWTVSITNSLYGKTLAYYSSILFTRNNLRSDHKGYYFKTICTYKKEKLFSNIVGQGLAPALLCRI